MKTISYMLSKQYVTSFGPRSLSGKEAIGFAWQANLSELSVN